jgi:hypothetical protein
MRQWQAAMPREPTYLLDATIDERNITVKFFRTILTLALVTSVMGCMGAPEDDLYAAPAESAGAVDLNGGWLAEEAEVGMATASPLPAFGQSDRSGDVFTTAVRYCDANFDCNSACDCVNGTCQPDGFGPPPEGDYCAQPPQRACSSSGDCRSGCNCVIKGICRPGGFSPQPPADYCAQPPPDAYEYNDAPNSATSYLGSPQLGHNFHEPGDVDWILVYFGSAMTATFETYNLTNGANTYLAVYSYNYATGQLGAQVGANDDVCGFWWSPSCWASRVVVGVPANSVYAIQVSDINDGPQSVYDQNAPGYAFRIY